MLDPLTFLYFLIAILVALTVHEASHALIAYYLGDPTAKMRGRLSLNPIRHLDTVGSLVFLITMRIGWGKPVPINPANFQHPVRDSALTSLAGPFSNFVLAFAVIMPIKYMGPYMPDPMMAILWSIFDISVLLGVFNLLPFPPLDGSKILGILVPPRFYPIYFRFLEDGMKYFVAIILVDVFIFPRLLGVSFFFSVISFLHEKVSLLLLLGT